MFCEQCDGILVPVRDKDAPAGALQCKDCDYNSTDEESLENFIIKETVDESEKSRIEVVEEVQDYGGVPEEMKEELRELQRESLEYFEM